MASIINNKENLIVRYLCGDASSQDINTVESMLQSDEKFKQLFEETRFVWEQASKPMYNKEQDWQAIRKRIGFVGLKKPSLAAFFMKIAAVAIIVLAVSAGLWTYWNVPGYGRWIVFETGPSSDSVILPDASIVVLNRNSSLKYRNAFSGNERKVTLKGEGYFEVQTDVDRPFKVDMGKVLVKVTGTTFHLDNRHPHNTVELNVTKGAVLIYNAEKQISVKEGERAFASATYIQKSNIPNNNFISWKTGLLEFHNASLKEITAALKNHFPEIEEVQINDDSEIMVTTRFQKQSLKEITEELSMHFQKKFVLNNAILVISD